MPSSAAMLEPTAIRSYEPPVYRLCPPHTAEGPPPALPFECVVLESPGAPGGPSPALLHELRQRCKLLLALGGAAAPESNKTSLHQDWYAAVFDTVIGSAGEAREPEQLERYLASVGIEPQNTLCFASTEEGAREFAAADAGLIIAPTQELVKHGADVAASSCPTMRQLAWLHQIFVQKLWCVRLWLSPAPDAADAACRAEQTSVATSIMAARGHPCWAEPAVEAAPRCTARVGDDMVACPDWTGLEPSIGGKRVDQFGSCRMYLHSLDVGVAQVSHAMELSGGGDPDVLHVRVYSRRFVNFARGNHGGTELSVSVAAPAGRRPPPIRIRSSLRVACAPPGFKEGGARVQGTTLTASYVSERSNHTLTIQVFNRLLKDEGKGDEEVAYTVSGAGDGGDDDGAEERALVEPVGGGGDPSIDVTFRAPRSGARYIVEKTVVMGGDWDHFINPSPVARRRSSLSVMCTPSDAGSMASFSRQTSFLLNPAATLKGRPEHRVSAQFGGVAMPLPSDKNLERLNLSRRSSAAPPRVSPVPTAPARAHAPSAPGNDSFTSQESPGAAPHVGGGLVDAPPTLGEQEEEHRSAWRLEWDRADMEVQGARKAARCQRALRLFRFHQVSSGDHIGCPWLGEQREDAAVPQPISRDFAEAFTACGERQTRRPSDVISSRLPRPDEATDNDVAVEPHMPEEWDMLRFNIALAGRWYRFTLTPGRVMVLMQGPTLGVSGTHSETGRRLTGNPTFCIQGGDDGVDAELNVAKIHPSAWREVQIRHALTHLGSPDGSTGGFYGLMRRTRFLRLEVVRRLFSDGDRGLWCDESLTDPLRAALAQLNSVPRPRGWRERGKQPALHVLRADATTRCAMLLDYEKSELRRDIHFLEGGRRGARSHDGSAVASAEAALKKALAEAHRERFCPLAADKRWLEARVPGFDEMVERAVATLRTTVAEASEEHGAYGGSTGAQFAFRNFITDRDGTTNNYCDRYASGVQSAWNAAWLGFFARTCAENALFITAAPLGGRPSAEGLMELSVNAPGVFTYTGSKGREYFDHTKQRVLESQHLPSAERELIEEMHRRLGVLCAQPFNAKFLGLGSGLQRKFGEVTMARNDPTSTVSEPESRRFMAAVRAVKDEIDPEDSALDIHDTGTDLEIFPRKVGGRPAFTKGDGVQCLDRKLRLRVGLGPNLVCGDTGSDVPMIETALRLMAHELVPATPSDSAADLVQPKLGVSAPGLPMPAFPSALDSSCDSRDVGGAPSGVSSRHPSIHPVAPPLSLGPNAMGDLGSRQQTAPVPPTMPHIGGGVLHGTPPGRLGERQCTQAVRPCGARLAVLFVVTPEQHTKDGGKLAARVQGMCAEHGAHCCILPSPDCLVAALGRYAQEVAEAQENAEVARNAASDGEAHYSLTQLRT